MSPLRCRNWEQVGKHVLIVERHHRISCLGRKYVVETNVLCMRGLLRAVMETKIVRRGVICRT